MSSQPPSPAAVPTSSQQLASSPQSKADSAVQLDDSPEKAEHDSSFQSNSSERHPKGKRKRTAAKDKAILEAAYNTNPKPDKAARLDIVQRVSLNEKEVQIWFQNRRQNDRRKSRPLSPQEIAALQYGGMLVLSSDSAPNSTNPPPSSGLSAPDTYHVPSSSMPEGENASASSSGGARRAEPLDTASVAEADDMRMVRRQSVASTGVPAGLSSSQPVEFTAGQPPQPNQPYRSGSVGYFANRLHAGTSSHYPRRSPDSYRHEFMPASRPSTASGPVLPPPHQSSKFRLSMSVEGKAELVQQLSPSRLSPSTMSDSAVLHDRPNVQRTHSAAGSITLPPISALTASLEANVAPSSSQPQVLQQPQPRLHPRLYRSRSRDVHAWEMACEANSGEPRDELIAYAERESSGSAIAAISLLRTLSSSSHMPAASHSTGMLQSNNAKRNVRPAAHPPTHIAKKPKLGRSSSSIGRLQTQFVNTTTEQLLMRRDDADLDANDIKRVKPSLLRSPGGDSDKENWSPDSDGNAVFRGAQRMPAGRRPLPSAPLFKVMPSTDSLNSRRTMGRVLGESTNRSLLGRASTAPTARRKRGESPVEIFTDGGNDANASDNDEPHRLGRSGVTDDEVEKFMRGEISPSKKGAASAIAGLLALSQGNWR